MCFIGPLQKLMFSGLELHMCFCSSFWLSTERKAVCAPLKRFCYTGMMTRHMYCICNCFFSTLLFCFHSSRISLKKMPSIRETLSEMGVSAEQVLTELAQRSNEDTNNGTVPTPLTNYLDVRHAFTFSAALFFFCFLFFKLMTQTGASALKRVIQEASSVFMDACQNVFNRSSCL